MAGVYQLGGLDTEAPHDFTVSLSHLAKDDLGEAIRELHQVDLLAIRRFEQKAARLALVNGSMPQYLGWLQSQLLAHGGEYFADGRLTVADLKVFVDVRGLNSGRLDHVPTDLVEKVAPALNAHMQRIAQLPAVVAYYAQFAAR